MKISSWNIWRAGKRWRRNTGVQGVGGGLSGCSQRKALPGLYWRWIGWQSHAGSASVKVISLQLCKGWKGYDRNKITPSPVRKQGLLGIFSATFKTMFHFRIIQFYFSGYKSWRFCLLILCFSVGTDFVLKVVNKEAPLSDCLRKCESFTDCSTLQKKTGVVSCFYIFTTHAECESRLTLGCVTIRWRCPSSSGLLWST